MKRDWCLQGGSRPHVIFAKNEVRISVFDDGSAGKDLPTGFSAEVEGNSQIVQYIECVNVSLTSLFSIYVAVIDLYDGEQYSNLSKTHAYSNVRKLNG